jgi:hypothetical protein
LKNVLTAKRRLGNQKTVAKLPKKKVENENFCVLPDNPSKQKATNTKLQSTPNIFLSFIFLYLLKGFLFFLNSSRERDLLERGILLMTSLGFSMMNTDNL